MMFTIIATMIIGVIAINAIDKFVQYGKENHLYVNGYLGEEQPAMGYSFLFRYKNNVYYRNNTTKINFGGK